MGDDFDTEAFLDWLDDHDGGVPQQKMDERWPNFPWENVTVGITVALDDDWNSVYYKRDLRRAAKGLPNHD